MSFYKIYIDPLTGKASEATNEQIEKEPNQVLLIGGIQAIKPPPMVSCYFMLGI